MNRYAAVEGIDVLELEDGFTVVSHPRDQISYAYHKSGAVLVADGETHAYDIAGKIADWLIAEQDRADAADHALHNMPELVSERAER